MGNETHTRGRWMAALGLALTVVTASACMAQDREPDPIALLQAFVQAEQADDTEAAARAARALAATGVSPLQLDRDETQRLRLQLAKALANAGDAETAITLLETLAAELDEQADADPQFFADSLALLATVRAAAGDLPSLQSALSAIDQAIEVLEAHVGEDSVALIRLIALRKDLTSRLVDAPLSPAPGQAPRSTRPENARDEQDDVQDVTLNVNIGPELRLRLQQQLQSDDTRLARLVEARTTRREELTPMDGGAARSIDGGNADAAPADFELVRVFYGTNRAPTGKQNPVDYYGHVRNRLETGVVTVSVPITRELGAIPRSSIWRGEFRPDPAKHVIVEDLEAYPDLDKFADELRRAVDRSRRREAFIYIHGFNNDFQAAAERTATLAMDLELDGAPVMYSWPSRGGVLGYFADSAQVVKPVVEDLERFLTLVAQAAEADTLHVVAHSMGNRYLLAALEEITDERGRRAAPLFDEVVFAAPDVDAEDFAGRLPDVRRAAKRMTLYASADDAALRTSMRLAGGYARAGDARTPVLVAQLDTVDTAPAPAREGGLGHGDVFEAALDDFRAVAWFSLDPQQRCILAPRLEGDETLWSYEVPDPETCDAGVFRAAIVTCRRLGPQQTRQLLDNQIEFAEEGRDAASAARWRNVRGVVDATCPA